MSSRGTVTFVTRLDFRHGTPGSWCIMVLQARQAMPTCHGLAEGVRKRAARRAGLRPVRIKNGSERWKVGIACIGACATTTSLPQHRDLLRERGRYRRLAEQLVAQVESGKLPATSHAGSATFVAVCSRIAGIMTRVAQDAFVYRAQRWLTTTRLRLLVARRKWVENGWDGLGGVRR